MICSPQGQLRIPAHRDVFHEEQRERNKKKGGTGAHYRPCMDVSEEGISEEEEDEEQEES